VQRGDAEMEQKVNRVIRACVEMVTKIPSSVYTTRAPEVTATLSRKSFILPGHG